MKKIVSIIVCLSLLVSNISISAASAQETEEMTISNMQTNYSVNPIGIALEDTRLSYQVETNGTLSNKWTKTDGKITYETEIPFGTTSDIYLPYGAQDITIDGQTAAYAVQDGYYVITDVGSGTHTVTAQTDTGDYGSVEGSLVPGKDSVIQGEAVVDNGTLTVGGQAAVRYGAEAVTLGGYDTIEVTSSGSGHMTLRLDDTVVTESDIADGTTEIPVSSEKRGMLTAEIEGSLTISQINLKNYGTAVANADGSITLYPGSDSVISGTAEASAGGVGSSKNGAVVRFGGAVEVDLSQYKSVIVRAGAQSADTTKAVLQCGGEDIVSVPIASAASEWYSHYFDNQMNLDSTKTGKITMRLESTSNWAGNYQSITFLTTEQETEKASDVTDKLPLFYMPDNRKSAVIVEVDPENNPEDYYTLAYAMLSPRISVKGVAAKSCLTEIEELVAMVNDSIPVVTDAEQITDTYTYVIGEEQVVSDGTVQTSGVSSAISNEKLAACNGAVGDWLYRHYGRTDDLSGKGITACAYLVHAMQEKYDYACEDLLSKLYLFDEKDYSDYTTAELEPDYDSVRVIINADCCNEVDDEFAVLQGVLTEQFDIKAIIGTQHHGGPLTSGAADNRIDVLGIKETSANTALVAYKEMQLMWEYMKTDYSDEYGSCLQNITRQGTNESIDDKATDQYTAEELQGAVSILEEIKRAKAEGDTRPLYVLTFGAMTDVARAIEYAQASEEYDDITAEDFTVICSAGGGNSQPDFNRNQDRTAFMVVNERMPVWQVHSGVYGDSYALESELWAKLGKKTLLGDLLCSNLNRFMRQMQNNASWPKGEGFTLGDSPVIFALLDTENAITKYKNADISFTDKDNYTLTEQENGRIRQYTSVNGRAGMNDFFAKIRKYTDKKKIMKIDFSDTNVTVKRISGSNGAVNYEDGCLGSTQNQPLFYLGEYNVDDVQSVTINAATNDNTLNASFYALDSAQLSKAEVLAEDPFAVVSLSATQQTPGTTDWNTRGSFSAPANASGTGHLYLYLDKTGWCGNYYSISFLKKTADETGRLGDMNRDGSITAVDALLVLQAGPAPEETLVQRGDMNGDGELTNADAIMILQYASGERKEDIQET
ncbi:MAG: dockerin type I domain-containing protein [Lachnospiraceae bacterium]